MEAVLKDGVAIYGYGSLGSVLKLGFICWAKYEINELINKQIKENREQREDLSLSTKVFGGFGQKCDLGGLQYFCLHLTKTIQTLGNNKMDEPQKNSKI